MTTTNTPWAQTIREMVAAGTLRQGVWNEEDKGRRIACILGASSPGIEGIDDVDCAALCMPDWLAELTPTLFDGVLSDQANAYALRYAAVAERWCALTPEAWDRVSVAFRIACIEQALASAESAQPTPRPAYWDSVQSACTNVVAALKSGDAADAAWAAKAAARAAWAAGAAAWAAWAAGAAAEAARAEAAWAAARARAAEAAAWAARAALEAAREARAEAAARAAETAARAAEAAARAALEAAREARAEAAEVVAREAEAAFWTATKAAEAGFAKALAYARLFDALLDAINAELAADVQETTP